MLEVLATTIGTTGSSACCAKWNAPFLKESMSSFVKPDLVPSGNMNNPLFSVLTTFKASFNTFAALSDLAASMKKVPEANINQPKKGKYFNAFLAVTVKPGWKTFPKTMISKADWWLEIKIPGLSFKYFSLLTVILIPKSTAAE